MAYPASFIGAVFFDKFVNEKSNSFRSSFFHLPFAVIGFGIVFFTGTRGALIAMLVTTLLSTFVFSSEVRVRKYALIGIFLFLLVFMSIDTSDVQIFGKLQSLLYLLTSGDFRSEARYQIFSQAVGEWTTNPILGGSLYLSNSGSYPHNIILDIFLSTGVVGFVLFSGFLASIANLLVRRQLTPILRFSLLGVVVNLVMLSFSQSFILSYNLFLFLALLGASAYNNRAVAR